MWQHARKVLSMKKNISLDEIVDFIEHNTEEYSFETCDCDLFSAIVTYAEYAVRKKYEGNDEEAGLFMAAALNYAFLASFDRPAEFYRSEIKLQDASESDLIIHYALKLVEALFEEKPYKEEKKLQDALVEAVYDYILSKDAEEYDED